ncbi:hypothetical protein ACFL0W_04120 [Nanoarchaeota archaeon]
MTDKPQKDPFALLSLVAIFAIVGIVTIVLSNSMGLSRKASQQDISLELVEIEDISEIQEPKQDLLGGAILYVSPTGSCDQYSSRIRELNGLKETNMGQLSTNRENYDLVIAKKAININNEELLNNQIAKLEAQIEDKKERLERNEEAMARIETTLEKLETNKEILDTKIAGIDETGDHIEREHSSCFG